MAEHVYSDYIGNSIVSQEEHLLAVTKSVARNLETYVSAYSQDLIYMVGSDHCQEAEDIYWQTGDTKMLTKQMFQYVLSRKGQIAALYVEDHTNNIVISTDSKKTYDWIKDPEETDNLVEIWQCKDQQNQLFLALKVQQNVGLDYTLLLSIKGMYESIVSDVDLGKSGYLMLINSDGTTLMSYLVRDKKKTFPNLDFSKFENVITYQLTGAEGIDTFQDYYMQKNSPEPVTNMVAFAPVNISNDFLIVNSIIDYNEIVQPIITSAGSLLFYVISFMAALVFIFIMILKIAYANTKISEENQLLKEQNNTLEEINKKEEYLMHKQRLQTIGTLASGIVHEFNNLLTPIMGYSALILEDMNPENEQYEDVLHIYNASQKAKEIVNQLARLSRKDVENTFCFVEFDSMVKNALNLVTSGRPENIKLVTSLNCGKEGIKGNITQIYQVISNLCLNSFHSMKETGGTLILSTEIVDQLLILKISDTGSGIDPDIIKHIFDPFFSTKVAGEGTGLGLTVVQSIVESHNGVIFIESVPNKGTLFTIKLPIYHES